MPDIDFSTQLIQTKLNQPLLPVDLVPRPRLTEWLEQCRNRRPLTLVSAPAGYGKSTLISCWMQSADCPTAWLSVDEHDNELGAFLSYFLAAIETIFPGAMPGTQDLLMATPLPPIPAIAKTLINELNQIKRPYILVLDDYHLIEIQSIHDLLNELLLHPPRNLHLVLGTRMDPLLPLVTLRANSRVTEIRIQDLRFNQEETQLLFQKMTGEPIDQVTIAKIDAQAEGWVTGLRLSALAMRHRIGQDSFPGEISVHNRYVTDYLVSEILAKQASNLSDCMLKTSILERFCAGLCQALCFQETESPGDGSVLAEFNGSQFLEWLETSNLFVITLDDQYEWFRYHHLFRDFLYQELTRRLPAEEIAKLHVTAGRWYAQHARNEEALNHLITGGDMVTAIKLVAKHRFQMMNTTQWPRLERWLNMFPAEVIETSAELWMLKTWLVYHRSQFSELPSLLEHLAAIQSDNPNQEMDNHLKGEILSLRSLIAYHAGDAEGAISQARAALDTLPSELWIVRVMARLYLGGSLLLRGDESSGYQAFYGAFESEKELNKRFKATLLMTACYFHWITADLQSMAQAAKQSIVLCQESGHRQILGLTKYHLGCVRYQQNDLPAAEELFRSVADRPYRNYGVAYVNSVCGLGLTYQALGKEDEAQALTEAGIAFLLDNGITTLLPSIQATQAEVALRQRRLSTASLWAKKLDPVPPMAPMTWLLSPHLTLVKVWLAENTSESQAKAARLLSQLQAYLTDIHNTRFLIETFALQSLLYQATGEHSTAQVALEKALRLAQPGGFIRLFVDLGSHMATLLSSLSVDRDLGGYIIQIQSSFPGLQPAVDLTSQHTILEPLTTREVEILELLGERLTNKEIAAKLVISPATVKGHTINIYHKLEVKGRREAVEKAIARGILTPN